MGNSQSEIEDDISVLRKNIQKRLQENVIIDKDLDYQAGFWLKDIPYVWSCEDDNYFPTCSRTYIFRKGTKTKNLAKKAGHPSLKNLFKSFGIDNARLKLFHEFNSVRVNGRPLSYKEMIAQYSPKNYTFQEVYKNAKDLVYNYPKTIQNIDVDKKYTGQYLPETEYLALALYQEYLHKKYPDVCFPLFSEKPGAIDENRYTLFRSYVHYLNVSFGNYNGDPTGITFYNLGNVIKVLKKCFLAKNFRFVCVQLSLHATQNGQFLTSHANLMLIDKKLGDIYIIDPFGDSQKQWGDFNIDKVYKAIIQKVIIPVTSRKWNVFVSLDVCPVSSFQSLEDKERLKNDPVGFCALWSLYITDLLMANPDEDFSEVIRKAIAYVKSNHQSYSTFIRAFAVYLYKERAELSLIQGSAIDKYRFLENLSINYNKYLDSLVQEGGLPVKEKFPKEKIFKEKLSFVDFQPQGLIPESIKKFQDQIAKNFFKTLDIDFPDKLEDNYKIIRKLGSGFFGEVFEVEDLADGKRYAMKILEDKERYYQEVATLLRISSIETGCHSNVVCMINYKEMVSSLELYEGPSRESSSSPSEREVNIIILELMEGDLQMFIEEEHPPAIIFSAIDQIFKGVLHIHKRGFAYRDAKPDNILYSDGGRIVKIGDLGSCCWDINSPDSKPYYKNIPECRGIGMPYASPEMLENNRKAISLSDAQKGDVWALGEIFYQMLYKRKYKNGSTFFNSLDIEGIDFLQDEYHRGLRNFDNILKKMLTKNPNKRISLEDAYLEFKKLFYEGVPEHSKTCSNETTTTGNKTALLNDEQIYYYHDPVSNLYYCYDAVDVELAKETGKNPYTNEVVENLESMNNWFSSTSVIEGSKTTKTMIYLNNIYKILSPYISPTYIYDFLVLPHHEWNMFLRQVPIEGLYPQADLEKKVKMFYGKIKTFDENELSFISKLISELLYMYNNELSYFGLYEINPDTVIKVPPPKYSAVYYINKKRIPEIEGVNVLDLSEVYTFILEMMQTLKSEGYIRTDIISDDGNIYIDPVVLPVFVALIGKLLTHSSFVVGHQLFTEFICTSLILLKENGFEQLFNLLVDNIKRYKQFKECIPDTPEISASADEPGILSKIFSYFI